MQRNGIGLLGRGVGVLQAAEVIPFPSLASESEAELVRRLRARVPDAWAELYDTYYDRLRRYAIGRAGSPEEAEDVASQVFLRALSGIDSYQCRGKPVVAWLYGILHNVVREVCRKRNRPRTLGPDQLSADGELPDEDHQDPDVAQLMDLRAAMDTLTPRQKEVVTLLHFSGFNVREVATMLGKGERSIYYLEARALDRLKDELIAQDEVARDSRRSTIASISPGPGAACSNTRSREGVRAVKPATG
jgi:RNA polymerase sigma-70 factor (ECF subfamily)